MSYKINIINKKNEKKNQEYEFYDYPNFINSFILLQKSNIDFEYELWKEDISFEECINFLSINSSNSEEVIIYLFQKDQVLDKNNFFEWIECAKILDEAIENSLKI